MHLQSTHFTCSSFFGFALNAMQKPLINLGPPLVRSHSLIPSEASAPPKTGRSFGKVDKGREGIG